MFYFSSSGFLFQVFAIVVAQLHPTNFWATKKTVENLSSFFVVFFVGPKFGQVESRTKFVGIFCRHFLSAPFLFS